MSGPKPPSNVWESVAPASPKDKPTGSVPSGSTAGDKFSAWNDDNATFSSLTTSVKDFDPDPSKSIDSVKSLPS